MEHDEAALLLTDLLESRLSREVAAKVQEHLDACAECRQVATTFREVRTELLSNRPLQLEHPNPDDLVAYVTESSDLAVGDRGRLRQHLDTCPTCAGEAAMLRKARVVRESRESWWRPWRAAPPFGLVLRPALALLFLALLYPAYLGLVRLPRERQETASTAAGLEALRRQNDELRTSLEARQTQLREISGWTGAARILVLSSAVRAAGGAATPIVELSPGQPYVPILVAYYPFGAQAGRREAELDIVILSKIEGAEARGASIWQYRGAASRIWSQEAEGLSLLVPSAELPPGEYRLEVRRAGDREIEFAAPFAVAPYRQSPAATKAPQ